MCYCWAKEQMVGPHVTYTRNLTTATLIWIQEVHGFPRAKRCPPITNPTSGGQSTWDSFEDNERGDMGRFINPRKIVKTHYITALTFVTWMPSQPLVFGRWSFVFGLWSLVFILGSLVFGPWSVVFGLLSSHVGLWSSFFGLWSLVLGLWSSFFGLCSLVLGLWSLGH